MRPLSEGDPRPRFRTLLFDLDGTLIDSEALILSSYRHTMRTHLGTVPSDDAWMATMGRPLVVQLREFARNPAEVEAMVRTYSEHNRAHHDALVRPFRGMRSVVRRLRDAGLRLGIVTSKRRRAAERGLRRCRLPLSWFGALVTPEDVARPKPDPEPVRAALRLLSETDPGRALFVGDSVHDIRAAHAAGCSAAAALWGPYRRAELEGVRPEHWLSRPSDLVPLVGLDPRGDPARPPAADLPG